MCIFEYSAFLISFARSIDDQLILRNETSVFILQSNRSTRKMSNRKRRVKKVTSGIDRVINALHELLSSRNINILQLNDVNYGLLAKKFGIPQKEIKRVIFRMQPTVKLQKKCVSS